MSFALIAPNISTSSATVIDDPEQITAYLQALHPDLKEALFYEVIGAGLARRRETTRASAPGASGVQQWLEIVESMRTRLIECGWHPQEKDNCPFITAPDYSISIVVMTGDRYTGRKNAKEPTNKAKKGAVTKCFVEQNQQLKLFNTPPVYVLLHHYDEKLCEIRSELSLPTGFSNGKITAWGHRLILGSISNNPTDFTINKDEPNVPVTVDVEPKTGTF